MKSTLLSITLLGGIALIIVASCHKTYNDASTVVTVPPSLNQVFAGLRSTPQTLTVTAGVNAVVYGAKGTKLHFYPNSFKDASGHTITSGTVNLQLTEMYKAGDMICNRATTMANGQILQSGGQVSIVATMNGQQVFTNGYGISFVHSNPSSAPMALFYGATTNADSVATWTQSDTTKQGVVATGTTTDSTGGGSGSSSIFFDFDTCTNLTWANCDWFYTNDSSKTSVSIILPDTSFNPNNTQAFLVLPNVNRWGNTADTFNAVLGSDGGFGNATYTAATNTMAIISEGQSAIVPAGLNYKLVVITNKNGQYYYWQTTGVVPHNGIIATAALATDSQGDIVSRLQGL